MKKLLIQYPFIGHLIFWSFIVLFIADYYWEFYPFGEAVLWGVTEVLFYAAASYFNYWVLMPRLLERGKVGRYWSSFIGMLLFWVMFFKWTDLSTYFYGGNSLRYDFSLLLNFSLFTFISTLVWYYQQYYENQQQQIQTEKDKLETELQFLKAQISPHFLFNSLNNIYSLCLQKDENAAPMVAKLSQIMRYILDSSSEERVSLEGELVFLQDYIDLQLLKKTKSENVDFYMEGIEKQHEIAPLLLVNFLENAFKFSGIYQEESAWIETSCVVEDDQLHFQLANSRYVVNDVNGSISSSGIGMANVKRQLALHYPERQHALEVKAEKDTFSVDLKIRIMVNH